MCCSGLWLEGIQLRPETNNKYIFLPIRLCFITVYTYPNPKSTPYSNANTVIIVEKGRNIDVRMRSKPW